MHKINLLIGYCLAGKQNFLISFKPIFKQFGKAQIVEQTVDELGSRVGDNCYLSAYLIRKKQKSDIAAPFLNQKRTFKLFFLFFTDFDLGLLPKFLGVVDSVTEQVMIGLNHRFR